MKIIKRNGSVVEFDTGKIVDAISKASIRAEEKEVEKKIKVLDLFAGAGGIRIAVDETPGLQQLILEIIDASIDEALGYAKKAPRSLDDIQKFCDRIFREMELERLEKRRQELRTLRKIKTERVSNMIRTAWLNRNLAVGRSSTSSVTDTMLLSIPTPPTFKAANRSLLVGGAVIAF